MKGKICGILNEEVTPLRIIVFHIKKIYILKNSLNKFFGFKKNACISWSEVTHFWITVLKDFLIKYRGFFPNVFSRTYRAKIMHFKKNICKDFLTGNEGLYKYFSRTSCPQIVIFEKNVNKFLAKRLGFSKTSFYQFPGRESKNLEKIFFKTS